MTEASQSLSKLDVGAFVHRQSAHCESGVTANLLRAAGCDITEAMAFGVGSGIFFAHIPFIKVMDLPITSFRTWPGSIATKTFRRLGLPLETQTFSNERSGVAGLDALLARGIPTGAQVSVLWLDYLPKQFRFPFNAHHVTVLRREGEHYVISDPITETLVTCSVDLFTRARFAKGALAPKGKLFYAAGPLNQSDMRQAALKGLRETSRRMLFTPLPYFGLRAIPYLAKQMTRWPKRLKDKRLVHLNLAQVIRMQEEIGTGGAGFRFLYAAFLQEASHALRLAFLSEASELLTQSGDQWRQFAAESARLCRERSDQTLDDLSQLLLNCHKIETSAFRLITKALPSA